MKYISFVWWIAKYCDFFYFFLFVICVCLHPHINTPAVNCEERSKLSTGGYQLTGRVHGLSRANEVKFLRANHIIDYKTSAFGMSLTPWAPYLNVALDGICLIWLDLFFNFRYNCTLEEPLDCSFCSGI